MRTESQVFTLFASSPLNAFTFYIDKPGMNERFVVVAAEVNYLSEKCESRGYSICRAQRSYRLLSSKLTITLVVQRVLSSMGDGEMYH